MTVPALMLMIALGMPSDTVSREVIHRELSALVRIDTVAGPDGDTVEVVGFTIDKVDTAAVLGPFLKAHGRLVWYLANHTKGAESRMIESAANTPSAVRDSIVAALRSDSVFNNRVAAMLAVYWSTEGQLVAGHPTRTGTDTVTAARLNRIAARFFYPDRMSAVGDTLFTHICAGINGISDLQQPVDLLVEAFVFDAVTTALFRPQSPLMTSFQDAIRVAKATSESNDPTTRIRRAQGALWIQLERDPHLSAALVEGYKRHSRSLPFRLVGAVP